LECCFQFAPSDRPQLNLLDVLIEPRFNVQLCATAPLLLAAIFLLGRYEKTGAGGAQADEVLYNVLDGGNDGLYDDVPAGAGGGVPGVANPLYGAMHESSTDGEDLYNGFGDGVDDGGVSGYMDVNATPDDVPSGEYDSWGGGGGRPAIPGSDATGYMDVKATQDDAEASGYMDVSVTSGVSNPMCVFFPSVFVWCCFVCF
jgi:hypothetical protein